jgi:endonuclease/exonuclease/phosphatase family metal-dependent hydrolase
VRRGIPTIIGALLVTVALAIWGWSLGAGKGAGADEAGAGGGAGGALAARPTPAAAKGWGGMRVMAANIRLSEPNDGANAWTNRRELVVKTFLKYQPEIIACQEVSPAQGAYLNKELARWYAYYPRAGVGKAAATESGGQSGRGGGARAELLGMLSQTVASLNTLYYRTDRFEILDGEAGLVLPEEPQANPTENTYFSMAVLKEKGTGRTLIVVDVHFRHGVAFSVRCAERIREKLAAWERAYPGAGAVVLGDMNHDRTSKLYATLAQGPRDATQASGGRGAENGPALRDAFDYARKPAGGLWGTYHQFTGTPLAEWPTDLIFFSDALSVASGGHTSIVRDTASLPAGEGGSAGPSGKPAKLWPSDHFFVVAELEWSLDRQP